MPDRNGEMKPTHTLTQGLGLRRPSWGSAPDNFSLPMGAKVEVLRDNGNGKAHVYCGGDMFRDVDWRLLEPIHKGTEEEQLRAELLECFLLIDWLDAIGLENRSCIPEHLTLKRSVDKRMKALREIFGVRYAHQAERKDEGKKEEK